ncbi:MAG: SEC-C domain-containing protein [Saprospiraceae bacterium]|nr:SEC-C domain-containing protein [Saprospiraceae bacterium]
MYHLNIQFLKYMYREFKMPFVFSELIWQFIHTRKIFGKHGRKNWFYIDKKTLDKHIVDRYDNFLGSNELEIFGKVWGFPYLISFFNHFQLLSDEHSQLMLKNMEYFKKEMVQIASFSLWKMMFVFKWPKISDSVEDHLYQDFFESTFGIKDEDMKEHLSEFFPSFQETEEWNYQAEMKEKDLGTIVYSGDSPYKKEEPEIGRNAPCPCGSGKKYKNCCLNKKSD